MADLPPDPPRRQVHIYRLIAEASFEERVLMRARQKLILDALVIKKEVEPRLRIQPNEPAQ